MTTEAQIERDFIEKLQDLKCRHREDIRDRTMGRLFFTP